MYTTDEISGIIHAERYATEAKRVQYILTDSRSLAFANETIFFAIRGRNNDGHRYIGELYSRGVKSFVVERLPHKCQESFPDAAFLRVENTINALQQLACSHRKKIHTTVIGITGSNGKTTVKEWLYQTLLDDYNITRSPRSYNSQIGVPLSVWSMTAATELAIFEAGISMPGEMKILNEIIRPDIAIITNIGTAHIENFSCRKEICREKAFLFQNAAIAIYPCDDKDIADALSSFSGRHIAWSKHDASCQMYIKNINVNIEENSTLIEYSYTENNKKTHGAYTINNISSAAIDNSIACATACLSLGVSHEKISQRMPLLSGISMRLEVKEGNANCTIINDTYNNDLTSLNIALDFMTRRSKIMCQTNTLILSDILQSGLTAEALCQQLFSLVTERKISKFIGIGETLKTHFKPIADASKGVMTCHFFENTDAFLTSEAYKALHNETILIKGARKFRFDRITDSLEKKVHETVLEVNLNALIDNYNYYRSLMRHDAKLVCMVKADAYGAGAIEVAKTLQDYKVDYLAVAVADEGVALRKAGISCNIMVMNPETSAFKTLFDYNLEPEVYSFRLLRLLINAARHEGIVNHPVHIKLDTGMHRLGFHPVHDTELLIHTLRNQRALKVCSVFSHLVGADSDSFDEFSEKQYTLFNSASKKLQTAFNHKILRHICNSAAIEHFPHWHEDMCRLGLGLYGVNPRNNNVIHNVSTLKTTILQIHTAKEGDTIGYSRQTTLHTDSRIAAIPIGYADGLNRRLGNRNAYCLVNGQKAEYVGNICMDVAMIDITNINCKEGDTVEIFGENLPLPILAERCGTIPYELMTNVSQRVKRVYFKE